jgi:hypothetical protein
MPRKQRQGEEWTLGGHDFSHQSISVIEPVDKSMREPNTPFGFSPRDPPPPDQETGNDGVWEGMGL